MNVAPGVYYLKTGTCFRVLCDFNGVWFGWYNRFDVFAFGLGCVVLLWIKSNPQQEQGK